MTDIILTVTDLKIPDTAKREGYARDWALHGVSFTAERGQFFLVVGGAGAGKGTLLGCLGNNDDLHRSAIPMVCYALDTVAKGVTDLNNMRSRFSDSGRILNHFCVVVKDGFQWETLEQVAMLAPIREEGATLFVSTEIHRLPDWQGKNQHIDKVLVLSEGRMCLYGTPAEIDDQIRSGADLSGIKGDDQNTLKRMDWSQLSHSI